MISVHDGLVSLYDGQFDIALLPPNLVEQSAVIRRTLSQSTRIWVASPGYLAQHGTPGRAVDLSAHFLLFDPKAWRKGSCFVELVEAGRQVTVLPQASMDGNEVMLRAAALAGTGIAMLPELMIREDLAAGHLVPILPDCGVPESDAEICIFYSHRELLPTRFRTFVDFCTEFFRAERMQKSSRAVESLAPVLRPRPSLVAA
jgi:DNA-binding transcriptional LysR family regulator